MVGCWWLVVSHSLITVKQQQKKIMKHGITIALIIMGLVSPSKNSKFLTLMFESCSLKVTISLYNRTNNI